MTAYTRPPAPEIDYEYLYDMLGNNYDFQSVWNEKENRYFVEVIRIKGPHEKD